jgi:hypothetical protein
MLPLLLLALKRIITGENYEAFLSETFRVPAFILMFSPRCGHCRAVHPTWLELIEKYAGAPDIIVGEVDCVAHAATCRLIHDAPGWPTFAVFLQGAGDSVHPNRTLEAFTALAEQIRRNPPRAPACIPYPAEYGGPFPALVSSDTAGEPACRVAHQIARRVPRGSVFVATGNRSALSVRLTASKSVAYSGNFTLQSVLEFASDWLLGQLGNWSLEEGLKSKRRLAFFVIGSERALEPFMGIVGEFIDRVLVGKFISRDFAVLHPLVKTEKDSLVVFDKEKKKFRVFGGLTKAEAVYEILRDLDNGVYEGHMDHNAELFSRPGRGHPIRKRKPRLLRVDLLLPIILVPLFLVLLVVVGLVSFVRSRVSKAE